MPQETLSEKFRSYIIIHYSEIGIKGHNKKFFVEKLIQNIREKIKNYELEGDPKIFCGRIRIKIKSELPQVEKENWKKALQNIFGIAFFSFALQTKATEKNMEMAVSTLAEAENFETFRITTKRMDKKSPLNSMEISRFLGAVILKKFDLQGQKKKVLMKGADCLFFVNIIGTDAILYARKIYGSKGLPIGTSGRGLSLISGGIDSPVATYFGQKRGMKMSMIHFHSYPQTSQKSVEKVRQLAGVLTTFDPEIKLYMCAFLDIQKIILKKIPDKLRILFYRRFMFRIAEKIAQKEKYQALITGESLGQVASQTIENMTTTQSVISDLPILRPLISFDKEEIIQQAKKIGSFEISIRPHEDCCTVFIPKEPETKAKMWEILKYEKYLETEKLVETAVKNIEIETLRLQKSV